MNKRRPKAIKPLPPSLDYLRKFRVPNRTARFTDFRLLTLAIQKRTGALNEPSLEPKIFAEALHIEQPSNSPLTDTEINQLRGSALDFADHTYPRGDSLREQILSVLPQNPNILPLDEGLRESLIHLLSHLIRGFPEKYPPGEFQPGLDYFSSALFTLNHIARISGTPVKWPQELYKTGGLKQQTPDWQNLALRPDGAPKVQWDWLTSRLRNRIRSLRYEPLRLMVAELNHEKGPATIRKQVIERVTGVPRASARHVYENLKQLITERSLIAMPSLGLKHRCIISTDRRQPWPMHSLYEHALIESAEFGSLQFFPQLIGVIGGCKDLIVGMDQCAPGSRHIVPAYKMIDGFRMVYFADLLKKFYGQTETIGQAIGFKIGHWDIMSIAQGGDCAQAVVGSDIGKQHFIVQNDTPFGNNFFWKTGGNLHHLVGTKGADFFCSGNQLIKIRFFPF